MARDFRMPGRRQAFLLAQDMWDRLLQDDIAHLVRDAVSLTDLSKYEEQHRPAALERRLIDQRCCCPCLSTPIATGGNSRRSVERMFRRNAGYRYIMSEHVPDDPVIASFRRRYIDRLPAVFATVLRIYGDASLIRLDLLMLDGTKVKPDASLDTNRSAATMLSEAQAIVELLLGEDALFRAAAADAEGFVSTWSHGSQAAHAVRTRHLRPAWRLGGACVRPDEGPPWVQASSPCAT